jgi:arylsulfatase A-like enzyme
VPIPKSMQGRDLTPLVRDQPVPWREDWYYEHVYNTKPPRRPIAKCEGVRKDRWKYVRYPKSEEYLYHLAEDPDEMRNLAADPTRRRRRNELAAEMDAWLHRTGWPAQG